MALRDILLPSIDDDDSIWVLLSKENDEILLLLKMLEESPSERAIVMGSRDASSTTRYHFTQLDGKNWKTFEFKARGKLEDDELWDYIAGPMVPATVIVQRPAVSPVTGTVDTEIVNADYVAWAKGNTKTMRRITEMVGDDQVAYIRDVKTAAEMWSNLRAIYEPTGMLSMIAIHEKLSSIKYKGIESEPVLAEGPSDSVAIVIVAHDAMRSPYASPHRRHLQGRSPFQDLGNFLSGAQGQDAGVGLSSLERERSSLRDAERARQAALQETPSRRHCRIPTQRQEQENRAGSPTPGSRRADPLLGLATLPDSQVPAVSKRVLAQSIDSPSDCKSAFGYSWPLKSVGHLPTPPQTQAGTNTARPVNPTRNMIIDTAHQQRTGTPQEPPPEELRPPQIVNHRPPSQDPAPPPSPPPPQRGREDGAELWLQPRLHDKP
ncbi:hypothetical protein B0H10DRAFT_2237774 [Mycena sp. CBHHK59/15]|nr:hypothetical protein B0H10DRAFT_2237774 [Mycena sp. CBHHK59/15]